MGVIGYSRVCGKLNPKGFNMATSKKQALTPKRKRGMLATAGNVFEAGNLVTDLIIINLRNEFDEQTRDLIADKVKKYGITVAAATAIILGE